MKIWAGILCFMLIISALPPQAAGAELPGSLSFTVSPERSEYFSGEAVTFIMDLENRGTEPIELKFSSSQQYDLEVTGPDSYFWRWSKGKYFLTVITSFTLAPGEKKSYRESWSVPENALPGTYQVRAFLTSLSFHLEASAQVLIKAGAGWRDLFFEDGSGDVITISTFNEEILALASKTEDAQMTWIGGKVEETDSYPWRFRFRPDSLKIEKEPPQSLRAQRILEIERNLSYWTSAPEAFLQLKPLSSSGSKPFIDIQGHWAKSPILALFLEGVLNGYPDGTFRPDGLLTRAEFAKMMVLALKLSPIPSSVPTFPDVPKDHWGYAYIETASKAGLFKGYPDGTFRPEEMLTREHIITVIARNAGWKIVSPSVPSFPDLTAEHWAYPYVETALEEGFLDRSDRHIIQDLWGPGLPATRGQTALLLARLVYSFEKRGDRAIIKADSGGGLVPVEVIRQHVPAFHLYGDGTFIALREGFVRTGRMSYARALDQIILFASYGFFQMRDLYEPAQQVYDASSTYIELNLVKGQKRVAEYAWGAPGEFRYLYTCLKRSDLGETQEYIPEKSTLFVGLLGPPEGLSEDQKGRLVELPEEFKKGIPNLSELNGMENGFQLSPALYSLIAPLLGAHERVIVAVEDGLAYSLIAKITLPYE